MTSHYAECTQEFAYKNGANCFERLFYDECESINFKTLNQLEQQKVTPLPAPNGHDANFFCATAKGDHVCTDSNVVASSRLQEILQKKKLEEKNKKNEAIENGFH